jgi:putative transposase
MKVTGRKRHILVDTLGLIVAVVVHAADVQDRDGAKLVLRRIRGQFARLRLIVADAGYAGALVQWVTKVCHWTLQIVKHRAHAFTVLPFRWIVERTFAWLDRCRRLSRDYEGLTETSEAMILIAMINLMLHRLCPERKRRKMSFKTRS